MKRYGLLKLVMVKDDLILSSTDPVLINEILYNKKLQNYIYERIDLNNIKVKKIFRGHIKQALIKMGFPVEDLAGYDEGDPCEINIRPIEEDGKGLAFQGLSV